jgi:hypothetical protein
VNQKDSDKPSSIAKIGRNATEYERRMWAVGNWVGWLWSEQEWERVCSGENLSECSRRLGAIAKKRGVKDGLTCMTGGGVPQYKPIRRENY